MSNDKRYFEGLLRGFLLAHRADAEVMAAFAAATAAREVTLPTVQADASQVSQEAPSSEAAEPLPPLAQTTKPKRQPRIGVDQVEQVRQLVAEGLTDDQIGARYGRGKQTVAAFRKQHDIKRPRGPASKRSGSSWGYSGPAPAVTALQGEATTYEDESGRKITRLPPGYARGAEPGGLFGNASAKPTSGSGY